MPKSPLKAFTIAGLIFIITAGATIGANAAAYDKAQPDIISMGDDDLASNISEQDREGFAGSGTSSSALIDFVYSSETARQLLSPLVKLAFYPAQLGTIVGYASVGLLGVGATKFWMYTNIGIGLSVVVGSVAAELRDRVAAVDGPVEYCGLCHVEPTWLVNGLLVVAVLLVASSLATGWPFGGQFR